MSKPVWDEVGLKEAEYRRVCDILGREPNYVELHMFGVMWSEHCSYKHSRATLKTLPTKGPQVLQGPGENAGVIKISDDLGVAFKIESHNHPSFVAPFHGAATGVGGILRDVFTMGARPIGVLNSLRFGQLDEPKQRELLSEAVKGMGHYAGVMGVPSVAGEVYFDESYRGNCLVNAMVVGTVHPDKIFKGVAEGVGNPIMVVGARTGRDGIHAASLLASAEFTEDQEQELPTTVVGDPAIEKRLLEACLEVYETGAVVGIQDMGAAGLMSSSSEMAAKGDVGIEMDVRKVPAREDNMQAWEYLLSESQERMLVCVTKGREAEVKAIFDKWELESAVIGHVTDDGMIRVMDGGQKVAEVPAKALTDEAPVYHPAAEKPAYLDELRQFDLTSLPQPEDWNETLLKLLNSTNIGSRDWIASQFDQDAMPGTVLASGADAGVVRLPGQDKVGIVAKPDCNSRYVYINPRRGTAIAVAEAARNCVVTGAKPMAITNNLNFGNPEKPEIFWTFKEAVAGMSEACKALETPVTGGNVSFYNETSGEAIYPTPTIGMVAIHENLDRVTTAEFKNPGDVIVLLGENKDELGGSEYCKVIHGVVGGDAPALDLEQEKKLQTAVLTAIHEGIITAAHDVAEGGVAVALAEMAIGGDLGCQTNLFLGDGRVDGHVFGETQSRILVTVNGDSVLRLRSIMLEAGVPHHVLGDVTDDGRFKLAVLAPGSESDAVLRRENLIDLSVSELAKAYKEAIPQWMGA